jgi:hypothetical protein
MDDLIAGTGVAFRALTAAGFMDNVLRQVQPIKERGLDDGPARTPRHAADIPTTFHQWCEQTLEPAVRAV